MTHIFISKHVNFTLELYFDNTILTGLPQDRLIVLECWLEEKPKLNIIIHAASFLKT